MNLEDIMLSETSQSQKTNSVSFCLSDAFVVVNIMQRNGAGEVLFNWYGFSVLQDEKNRGDGSWS